MSKREILQIALLSIGLAGRMFAQAEHLPAGTEITVRTIESIDAKSPSAGRVYHATVDREVLDRSGRVAIPKGAEAELVARSVGRDSLALDLESIVINGKRYAVG